MESVKNKKLNEVSIELVRKLFRYDPIEGTITRIVGYGAAIVGQTFYEGKIAVYGTHIRFGRLAWALHNGMWPPEGYYIDHIDGTKANNKITNLRLATPTQNQQNKAGYGSYSKGVTWRDRQSKPFQAKIRVNGTRIHLGSFATEEEAARAYKEACFKYHGEFACPK